MKDAKRNGLLAAAIALAVLGGALGAADREEYKLIRRALAGTAAPASAPAVPLTWLKIEVKNGRNKADNVSLSLPLALVEMVVQACPDRKIALGCRKPLDWKRVWEDLKRAGPLSLVEVRDGAESVRIWFE